MSHWHMCRHVTGAHTACASTRAVCARTVTQRLRRLRSRHTKSQCVTLWLRSSPHGLWAPQVASAPLLLGPSGIDLFAQILARAVHRLLAPTDTGWLGRPGRVVGLAAGCFVLGGARDHPPPRPRPSHRHRWIPHRHHRRRGTCSFGSAVCPPPWPHVVQRLTAVSDDANPPSRRPGPFPRAPASAQPVAGARASLSCAVHASGARGTERWLR